MSETMTGVETTPEAPPLQAEIRGSGAPLSDPLAEALERLSDTSGVRKCAITLLVLGEEIAREIFRHLDDDDVERILRMAEGLNHVPAEEVLGVLEELTGTVDQQVRGVAGHQHRIRKAAEAALGRDTLTAIMGRDSRGAAEKLEAAADRDPLGFAQVVSREHPQVVAVVLAMISPDIAATVLKCLPVELKTEVVRRVANIRSVPADILAEVAEIVGRELKAPDEAGPVSIDGRQVAVGILKQVGLSEEQSIFEDLDAVDDTLAADLKSRMFVFEDILTLPDRAVQQLLREIDKGTLALALKSASKRLKTHILSNMSSNAAMLVVEDMEVMQPPRVSQVEEAQEDILKVIMRLAEEDKIIIRPEV